MRFLKLALYALVAILAIYLAICAMSPTNFKARQSITINARAEKIFPHITDFNQWKSWSEWAKSDPDMTSVYEGTPGTVGHKQTWKSKKEGDGVQDIVALRPYSYIKTGLCFTPDPKDVNYSEFNFSGDSTKTTIDWSMNSNTVPFVMRGALRMMGVEQTLNDYFAKSLNSLKVIVEKG